MAVWFVRLQLDLAASEEQATTLALNFGHAYVDGNRNRTEVIMYVAYTNIVTAISEAVSALNTFVSKIGFHTRVAQVEVMSRKDRLRMLADEGITEESIPKP